MITKILKEQNNICYCTIGMDGYFYMEEKTPSMEYDVTTLLKNLTIEERKFLVAECILDSPFLRDLLFKEGVLPKVDSIYNLIRTYTEKQLTDIIMSIQYTRSFNGYLCYMLNDWESDNFESKEERSKYTF